MVWRLEEFRALRAEIDRRSGAQQTLVGLQLTASAAIAAIAAGHASAIAAVLIISPLSFFLALQWTDHHAQIQLEGQYIMTFLEPMAPGLGWETWLRSKSKETLTNPDIVLRVVVPQVLLFIGPPMATLLWLPLVVTSRSIGSMALWAVDALLTLATGLLVVKKCWPIDDQPGGAERLGA